MPMVSVQKRPSAVNARAPRVPAGPRRAFDRRSSPDYDARMSAEQTFAGIAQIIDFAIGREQEARRAYLAYAQATNRKGFRQLLLTMADMEGEHENKLRELRRRGQTPGLFREPRGEDLRSELRSDLGLSQQLAEVTFSADMDYGDFLVLVMKKEAEAETLYLRLMKLAEAAEVRGLFGLLAQEEAAHRAWVQERYDEDVLREN